MILAVLLDACITNLTTFSPGTPQVFFCVIQDPQCIFFLSSWTPVSVILWKWVFHVYYPRKKKLLLSFVLNLVPSSFTSWLFFLHWKRQWAADVSPGILCFCRHLSCLPRNPQVIPFFLSEESQLIYSLLICKPFCTFSSYIVSSYFVLELLQTSVLSTIWFR